MPVVLLVLGVSALLSTVVAAVRVRRPAWFSLPIQLTSMLVGETPLFHAALQVIALVGLGAAGAATGWAGWIGAAAMALSIAGLLVVQRNARTAPPALREALAGVVPSVRIEPRSMRSLVRPFHNSAAGIEIERDVAYGPDKRQRVDIYRPAGSPEGRPVLLYIHGGGWVSGDKRTQALTLLHEAARRGYVVVSANYRLAPRNKYPLWVQDVKAALVWVRATIAQYGGNPQWVAVAGGSAGGHLAAVLATTPNEPSLQPGAEDVDTRVAACVPLYGAFDFTDRWGIRGKTSMVSFLEKMVMSSKLAADRPTWELISPAHRGGPDTPPFFVVHGAIDVLLYREETRAFVDYLRGTGAPTVLYAELPHAQHAFDMIKSVRTFATVDAILAFLDHVHAAPARPGG